eukprot:scaffold202070_cov33-Tisochrysis_lutea.AAC.5
MLCFRSVRTICRYHHPPIYVTENGWSTRGDETIEEGIADSSRVYFLANYTSEIRRAIYEVRALLTHVLGNSGPSVEYSSARAKVNTIFCNISPSRLEPAPLLR